MAKQWRAMPTNRESGRAAPPQDAGDVSVSSALNDVPAPTQTPTPHGGDDPVAFAVMRKRLGGTDVYRASWEHACREALPMEAFEAVLQNAQRTPHWLPVVEGADVIEVLGPHTQVQKTRFRLGWPTSARDAILLTYIAADSDALVYVATSVPRTHDAPSYLRPAPPYVRAHVHLSALFVRRTSPTRLALTAYWSWDLHGALLGIRSNAMVAYFPRMLPSLVAYVEQERQVPYLASYGAGVEVTASLSGDEVPLELSYTVLDEDEDGPSHGIPFGPDGLAPPRSIAIGLPMRGGWALHVNAKAARNSSAQWRAKLAVSAPYYTLILEHDPIENAESFIRVHIEVRRAPSGVQVNDEDVAEVPSVPLPSRPPLLDRLVSAHAMSPASRLSDSPDVRLPRSTSSGTLSSTVPSLQLTPLASLVRRNYIYFTSLLQEPEAKWTRVSDLRGVTVTQLDSIDPTLVVYRAEATFVGLSVWDFFSTLSHPELAAQWDKTSGRAVLLRDMGGQSVVWHMHTQGSWTTTARDAVLVQTAYKSPNSIHLFAFSTDDTDAFPWLPPSDPSSIRTQVDLRGWSIEALSPTTVHVTLMEQSDPRGWVSKTAVPAQMIASMAGVGEYTIRNGGPPIVTRFLHARACTWRYDHEQATYTLEYAAAPDEILDEADDTIECEIRCSMESWAPNLDVAVTPPPRNVACLRRHKLSLGGGGLWMTIEHSTAALANERVVVTVRKGPAQSKERNVVLLNGTRARVDSDDLDPAQVKELARRKRTKPQRVPLDFHPRAAPDVAEAEETEDAEEAEAPQPAPAPAPAAQHPMQSALDALFLLRRINSERHPDPAGVPAGWALVSERNGLYIRRKLLESLSPTVAVQRADKIVEGIAAEELLHLVSNLGCRALWDERMGNATTLASYGSGATATSWVAQGSFPFRPRQFVVSSLTAYGSQVAPLTPSGLMSPTTSRQPVYFHASASCDMPDVDPAKLNPQQLPLGRVLIDGWIFETLDPYSSASYAIPSTRATHVVAIDYGGAMPASINALWNAALPRAVLQLEHFLQTRGPTPSLRSPPAWMHVVGDGHDDDRTLVWTLQRPQRPVSLLTSDFAAKERTMRVVVLLPRQDLLAVPASPPTLSLQSTPTSPIQRAASRNSHKPRDATEISVVDVQIELQHYPQGYALDVAWAEAEPASDETLSDTFDLSIEPKTPPNDACPLQVKVLDRPPSALQAATRNAVDRSHKHLVRVELPGVQKDSAWYTQLQARGVAVRVTATPLAAAAKAQGTETGQVPVTCNGKVAEIVYGDESVRSLEETALVDQLERIARPGPVPSTPREMPRGWERSVDANVLAQPLARAHGLQKDAPPKEEPKPALAPAAPAPDAQAEAPSPAPAPMFGLLRPSSRSHSASRFNTTLSSMTQLVSLGAKDEEHAQLPGTLQDEPEAAPRVSMRGKPRYRLSTLVLVSIVSFLLGSLVRSLIQPADYILVPPTGITEAPPARPGGLSETRSMLDMAAREIDSLVRAARQLHVFTGQAVDGAARGDHPVLDTPPAPAENLVRWREVRRFFDVRLPGHWDVVLALVRR